MYLWSHFHYQPCNIVSKGKLPTIRRSKVGHFSWHDVHTEPIFQPLNGEVLPSKQPLGMMKYAWTFLLVVLRNHFQKIYFDVRFQSYCRVIPDIQYPIMLSKARTGKKRKYEDQFQVVAKAIFIPHLCMHQWSK